MKVSSAAYLIPSRLPTLLPEFGTCFGHWSLIQWPMAQVVWTRKTQRLLRIYVPQSMDDTIIELWSSIVPNLKRHH